MAEDIREQIIRRAWQDETFKQALLDNPKETLKREYNIIIPDSIELKAVAETDRLYYFVIPADQEQYNCHQAGDLRYQWT